MSDGSGGAPRRITYSFDFRGPGAGFYALTLSALVALLIGGWAFFDKALPALHFDGMIGPGCDAGNANCTYSNWRRGCSDEDVRARICDLGEYRREGGR